MSLKKVSREGQSHLYEGPLDFLRGAGSAAGQKAANGLRSAGQGIANAGNAVKQQVGDVVQAGAAASLAAEIDKAVGSFAKSYQQFVTASQAESSPAPQPNAQTGAEPVGAEQAPQAGTPPSPEVQAKQADLASKRGMRNQPEAQPQPGDEEAPDDEAQNQAIRDKNSGGVAAPFQTTNKPKGRPGKHGNEWTFSSFMAATSGDRIDEGVWDFVKGAGGAVADKVGSAIQKYSEKPSIFKDIYHAGVAASQAGDKAALQKSASASRDALVALIQKAGPQGPDLLTKALNKAVQDPAMNKKMFDMIMAKVNAA